MPSLNDEMGAVHEEVSTVRTRVREEIPHFFAFDVVVGNVTYNANNNSITATVEPSSEARDQLSEALGGVRVTAEGSLSFEFGLNTSGDTDTDS